MMQHYNNHDIQELPLSAPYFRKKVVRFLGENGLRLEAVDSYYVIEDAEGRILAGAGLQGDVIKCVAVAAAARSEGLAAPLVSAVVSRAAQRGVTCLKVFTKPENEGIFESLGFHVLARAPQAVLMENGRGLEQYCQYLRSQALPGKCGVVVMHANPFTAGHRYLLEQAAARVDHLYVIPVKEDVSAFPYAERKAMIEASGLAAVLEGSDYAISAATFPTYFLKDLSDAAETQMRLDLDLFCKWIAPALGASVRFVGTEPSDALTARYNVLMKELLPLHGMRLEEIDRLSDGEGPVSASRVRKLLDAGRFGAASSLCPETTQPYLLAALAERALRRELDTPLKPGLVCPDSTGAHQDMDYSLMLRGILSLRPFWPKIALASSADELRTLGIEAEKAMLAATGGVNTHRGAIFCMGLALNAAGQSCGCGAETVLTQFVMQSNLRQIAQLVLHNRLKQSGLRATDQHAGQATGLLKDARRMAQDSYRELFEDWLPFYRSFGHRPQDDTAEVLTLLRIMSTLDDTCVIKRVGYERAQAVKKEAEEMLRSAQNDGGDAWKEKLKELCGRYAAEGISPGGAADMLALTIFIDTLIL